MEFVSIRRNSSDTASDDEACAISAVCGAFRVKVVAALGTPRHPFCTDSKLYRYMIVFKDVVINQFETRGRVVRVCLRLSRDLRPLSNLLYCRLHVVR